MAKQRVPAFGNVLRERRLARDISLRKFAAEVGVSPAYLSQVERGNVDPPTAERVRRMAELLDEPPDEWIVMAGRIPPDVPDIIRQRPTEVLALLRAMKGLTAPQLRHLRKEAERLKKSQK